MPDLAALANNPYLADYSPEQKSQRLWSAIGNSLLGLGAGIAQGGASGQPWFSGIAPGLAMGSQMTQQAQQREEMERMHRLQMGLHLSEFQDKHNERQRLNEARTAYANGVPGGGIQAPGAPLMGPGSYTAQVGGDESAGRYDVSNGKGSGAYGKYQFMPDTWAGVAKSHPELNLPFNMKQATPDQQELAMKAFTADNANSLKTAGFDPQPTNLYLAHRFGVGGASKVLSADPSTPIAAMFPPSWAQQNPDMQGKTVGQFVAGAQSRYGSLPGFEGPGTGDNQALMPGRPQEPQMAQAAPQLRPPGQVPPMGPAVVMGGGEGPTPVQYLPNPQTPAPQMVAPPEPPVVPIPSVPPEVDQQLRQAVGAGLMTVDQAETKKAQIVRELHSHAQTQASQKFQRDLEIWKDNRNQANKSDTVTPLSDQEAAALGLPGNLKYQRSKNGKIEQIGNSKQPTYEDVKDAAGNIIGQRESGSNKLNTVNLPTPSDNPNGLVGPAFIETLPKDRAAQLSAYKAGRLTLSPRLQATKEGKQVMSDLFNAYPDDYDAIVSGARQKTLNAFTSGPESKTINAFNTTIQHLGELQKQGGAIQNFSEGFGPLNQTANMLKNKSAMGSGEVPIAKFEATKHAVIEEASKAFRGIGQSDAEIKAWGDKISSSQTPDQMQGVIEEMVGLLNSKIETLGHQYNQGMGASRAPLELLSPKARETLEQIQKNPIAHRGGAAPNEPAAPQYAAPPAAAIKHLQMSPGLRDDFDKKYGPGAADRALGR